MYGCTSRALMKIIKKTKVDTSRDRCVLFLNKSRKQHPRIQHTYVHLSPILHYINVSPARYFGHCRRRKDEFLNDVFLCTLTYGHVRVGRQRRICKSFMRTQNTFLLGTLVDRDRKFRRVWLCTIITTWWWWWW